MYHISALRLLFYDAYGLGILLSEMIAHRLSNPLVLISSLVTRAVIDGFFSMLDALMSLVSFIGAVFFSFIQFLRLCGLIHSANWLLVVNSIPTDGPHKESKHHKKGKMIKLARSAAWTFEIRYFCQGHCHIFCTIIWHNSFKTLLLLEFPVEHCFLELAFRWMI